MHKIPCLLLRSDTTEPLTCCDNGNSGTNDCLAYFKLHNWQHLLLHDLHATQNVRQRLRLQPLHSM